MLIWRCASQAAKEVLVNRRSIEEILKTTGVGWEISNGVQPPKNATTKELALWIRTVAKPCK